jgi:hypothetical protein
MKQAIIAALVVMAVNAAAQEHARNEYISVKFAVDGKQLACDDLRVDLRLAGRHIVPRQAGQSFTVPSEFDKKSLESSPSQKVDVTVSCGDYTLAFPKLHPSWVSAGSWEVGIAYPLYAIERFRHSGALERGTWLSYLISECNGCDPGVVTTVSQSDPPAGLVDALQKEQPNASGGRGRNIAYALAVFNSEYQRNRDYLLSLLASCLSRPKESPEDDECNAELLDFIANLYWRGDEGLLAPLLQLADTRKDVILEIGTFYADLLDRHSSAALRGLSELPKEKQELVCRLACEDDLSIDSPKFERVSKSLREARNEVADRCLSATVVIRGR